MASGFGIAALSWPILADPIELTPPVQCAGKDQDRAGPPRAEPLSGGA